MPDCPPDPKSDKGFAALIQRLDAKNRAGEEVTLGDALDQEGAQVHGAAILLLALPESIPLPIPSMGAVLGVPLILISAQLALFGEKGDLPDRARRISLPPKLIATLARWLMGPLRRAEWLSRDRFSMLARRERLVGVICLAMSLLLLLPIPFMNALPALALVVLSWGLVQRDGLFVGLGIAMAAGVVMILAVFADLVIGALR